MIATYEGEPVDVSWPAQHTDGQLGFRVPEPDSKYFISWGEGKGRPRTLDLALPGRMPGGEPAADDLDRLELVRLVAIIVDGLHRSDVVTAGLSWSTFLYTSAPRPALMLRRPEGIRRLGGEFLDPSRIMQRSEDWSTSPFDADRYQLALLAYRLLVSHEPDGEIEPWSSRGVHGLTEVQTGWLWRLWERSTGPVGTRPQAAEWMEALGA